MWPSASATSASPPSTRSDLDRARETASIIGCALRLPLHLDPALRERSFGDAEGHPLSELDPAVSGIELDRVVDADARPPAGESLSELYGRVRDFIAGLEAARDRTATSSSSRTVVSSGSPRPTAAASSVDDMAWGPVPNASVWGLSRPHPPVAVVQ